MEETPAGRLQDAILDAIRENHEETNLYDVVSSLEMIKLYYATKAVEKQNPFN